MSCLVCGKYLQQDCRGSNFHKLIIHIRSLKKTLLGLCSFYPFLASRNFHRHNLQPIYLRVEETSTETNSVAEQLRSSHSAIDPWAESSETVETC